ncbi:uncharacterized protein LOC124308981 isoform X1 [Neodiprion virginianus]|uniref:uncharacterized protein LOC124308981 isoform X1 n=1 Tax=Neodiprion virginianus TaxID=2961670 RepID=UPI001EE71A8D|nr:uncharacterized protein LOC124308981 isoform X1 [Neodiprion virginianus]
MSGTKVTQYLDALQCGAEFTEVIGSLLKTCFEKMNARMPFVYVKMLPNIGPLFCLMLFLGVSTPQNHPGDAGVVPDDGAQVHHRQKRLLWVTNDGRIALPPGTVLTITPTILLPFVRYPPYGFLSNMSMSFPFTIDFDKLGLTDNENPYGALPPVFGRAFQSREAGMALGDFIASFMKHRLQKREVPEVPKNAFQGGERALLYGIAEDMLSQFGMDGKACLLRAICEVHGHPLDNFGFVGEIIRLFFTASKSPFAELMKDYVDAEKTGKSHGECWPYFKACPKSLFLPSSNKYMEDSVHTEGEVDFDDEFNKIPQTFEQESPKRTPTRNTIHPAM